MADVYKLHDGIADRIDCCNHERIFCFQYDSADRCETESTKSISRCHSLWSTPFCQRRHHIGKAVEFCRPPKFNRNLRDIANQYFKEGHIIYSKAMFFYDQIRIYYQNLTTEESYALSYKPDSFFDILQCTSDRWPTNVE